MKIIPHRSEFEEETEFLKSWITVQEIQWMLFDFPVYWKQMCYDLKADPLN